MSTIGDRTRKARERMGWSQSRVARSMQTEGHPNFHQNTVSLIEKGERKVTTDECAALARVLGVLPTHLAGWEGSPDAGAQYLRGYHAGISDSVKSLEALRSVSNGHGG